MGQALAICLWTGRKHAIISNKLMRLQRFSRRKHLVLSYLVIAGVHSSWSHNGFHCRTHQVSFMMHMSPQLFLIHTTYVCNRFFSVTTPVPSLLWLGCMDALRLLPAAWRHWFTGCRNAPEECANVHLKILKLSLKFQAWWGGWTKIQAS